MCSAMYPSIGFDYLNSIQDFDIVNLHWIPTFVSLEAIAKIRAMGIPLVWTFHDQNPMTGACHYTHGCKKYQDNCSDCSQLRDNPQNITRIILETKIKYMPEDLVVVTPSQWLADCARKSAVFKEHRIEVIPNSLEVDLFKPVEKTLAKTILGIPPTAKVILFGACDLKEKRKGFQELLEAVKLLSCGENKRMADLIQNQSLFILTFGRQTPLLDQLAIPYRALEYVDNDHQLALIYSAADVFALPSLEDNLPNTMLESMACGTPVVAFSIGGIPDVVRDDQNGYAVPAGDVRQFAGRLSDIIIGQSMEESCRRFAKENFALDIQAKRYRDLYVDITRNFDTNKHATQVPVLFPEMSQVVAAYFCDSAIEAQKEWTHQDLVIKVYREWVRGLLFNNHGLSKFLRQQKISKVAVFGTRKMAEFLAKDLSMEEIDVVCFLDYNPVIQYQKFLNIDVFPPEWLCQNYQKIDAIVLSIEGNHDLKVKSGLSSMVKGKRPIYSWKELLN